MAEECGYFLPPDTHKFIDIQTFSWEDKMDKIVEFPTVRAPVIVGIHRLRGAHDVLQALAVAVPSLKPALDRVIGQVTSTISNYEQDVMNLEAELTLAIDERDSFQAKLIESEARFKLKCDEVERLHQQMHEKNCGFVETLQAKNREHAKLEAEHEMAFMSLQGDKEMLVQGNNEAERYIKLLLNHITKEGEKSLPAKLRRFE